MIGLRHFWPNQEVRIQTINLQKGWRVVMNFQRKIFPLHSSPKFKIGNFLQSQGGKKHSFIVHPNTEGTALWILALGGKTLMLDFIF